jgi:hypothetical protein
MAKRPEVPEVATLLPSCELSLRAERKSPARVTSYGNGVRHFLKRCATRHLA